MDILINMSNSKQEKSYAENFILENFLFTQKIRI